MPFDPNIPQAGTEIDAVQMRDQLNSLKALIDAVPPPGVSQAQLDTAIQGTSANSDGVAKLDMVSGDSDIQTIADKVDELLEAMRRN